MKNLQLMATKFSNEILVNHKLMSKLVKIFIYIYIFCYLNPYVSGGLIGDKI